MRARYLTMLPWFIDEWHRRAFATHWEARHDEAAMTAALRRLEKVIFFATSMAAAPGEKAEMRGVLGSELWMDPLAKLEDGETVGLDSEKGGSSLVTYFRPCVQLGFLLDGTRIVVPPLGQKIADVRRVALVGSPIVERIFLGGHVSSQDILPVVPHFSINALTGLERNYVRTAIADTPGTLAETVDWALRSAQQGAISPGDLIAKTYRSAVTSAGTLTGCGLAYAQYEMLRRVHFAMELALQAVRTSLDEGPRSVQGITSRIVCEEETSLKVLGLLLENVQLRELTMAGLVALIAEDRFLGRPHLSAHRFPLASSQAAYALALLMAAHAALKQAPSLAPPKDGVAGRVLSLVDVADGARVADVMHALLSFVVERHLYTTFRKMADGLPCSLRFLSDGKRLHRTEQKVYANMSGHRLSSVLIMLADIGYFTRERQTFTLSAAGTERLQ